MKLNKSGEIAFFVLLVATLILVVGCVVCKTDEQYTGIQNRDAQAG